jgi:manganese/iron transport system substrate-binding protein
MSRISNFRVAARSPGWPSIVLMVIMVLTAPLPFRWSVLAQDDSDHPSQPLIVAASTPIFADIIANVGGDRVSVWSVIPPGADPHTWEASPREMARLSESGTFVFMGAFLEPFIEAGAWRRAANDAGLPQLELAEQIELIAVDRVIDHGDHVHDLRGGDPHVWLDPLKTIEMVDVVAAHLTSLDPAGAATYSANAAAYQEELHTLHEEYEQALAAIPAERRKLVVFHDAYTYFAARYDFQAVGVVLPNPEAEPSAQGMAELMETIDAEEITVIFAEPQFDRGLLDSLAAETGVTVGTLLTDTFAGETDTYLELMWFNLASLRQHLAQE